MDKKRKSSKRKVVKVPLSKPLDDLFPESGRLLLTGGGKEFIEKIGVEAAKTVVLGVLKGDNIRAQTEPLTRRRVALVSNAMISLFTEGWMKTEGFTAELSNLAIQQIEASQKNDNASIWPAQWLIGLTGKSVQNVIRGKSEARELYMEEFQTAIQDAANKSLADFGDSKIALGFIEDDNQYLNPLTWEDLTRLATAIGCATMTIRGSDKSIYGKLFEKLILGSILTMMGFEQVDGPRSPKIERVFWLSDSSDTRECDATIRFKANKLVRFDIGFIGAGNSEIAKDKLTRFASEVATGGGTASSKTFIIIDKLPKTAKTFEDAAKSGAEIIQMSMKYWPIELATKLQNHLAGFEPEILNVPEERLEAYMERKLATIHIQNFLVGVTAIDLDVESELDSDARQIELFDDDDE